MTLWSDLRFIGIEKHGDCAALSVATGVLKNSDVEIHQKSVWCRLAAVGYLWRHRESVLSHIWDRCPDDEDAAKLLLISMLDLEDSSHFVDMSHKFNLEGLFILYLKKALTPGFWLCDLELSALSKVLNIKIAVAHFEQGKPEAEFHIIGSGSYKEEIKKNTKILRLRHSDKHFGVPWFIEFWGQSRTSNSKFSFLHSCTKALD